MTPTKSKRAYKKLVSASVIKALDLLASTRWTKKPYGVVPKDFDNAELLYYSDLYDPKRDVVNAGMWFPDLEGRLDWAALTSDPDTGSPMFVRLRQVQPSEVRGEIVMPMPIMVQRYAAWQNKDELFGQRVVFGRAPSGKWIPLMPVAKPGRSGMDGSNHKVEDLDEMVGLAISSQFNSKHRWSVYLAWPGSPGVRIPTDPTGAAAVFKLRDLPNGASRRSALPHWVEEHWMQNRVNTEVEHKVRTFLRGESQFTWNDLVCHIRPSITDEIIAEMAKEERDSIRGTWMDKRIEGIEPAYERPWYMKVLLWMRDRGRGRGQ